MAGIFPFALYDAFSDRQFGGSQAAIISDAAEIDATTRQQIARELGYAATAFVSCVDGREVTVNFLSTVMELPMCGHGTMGLVTWLAENKMLDWDGKSLIEVTLNLPAGSATVEISPRSDGRPFAMLKVRPAVFRDDNVPIDRLCGLLGLSVDSLSPKLPLETAVADFTHLVVPLRGLIAMASIAPDFDGLIQFSHDYNLETITVCCQEVVNPKSTVHVRDFCPAVGVTESAAAGTTNAAIAGYLLRHELVPIDDDGRVEVLAEQGLEIDRPSEIHSLIAIINGRIGQQMVGGVATPVIEGTLTVP